MISAPVFIDLGKDNFGKDCPYSMQSLSTSRRPNRRSSRVGYPLRIGFLKNLLSSIFLLALLCGSLHAQTIEDGFMMSKNQLFTGVLYSHDSWDHYWEGALRRTNGNLGTVTTQNTTWSGNYGITDRLNVIAIVPYVWTHASQGVLHDMRGLQDFTLAGKYQAFETGFTRYGKLRVIGVVSASIPLTDYTPDFQPLSIGSASKRIAARPTLYFEADRGWFLNASAAYTWRGNVTLDRSSYFTENQLFLTNQVAMPNVFDYTVSAGYVRRGLMASTAFVQQKTLGGGDIRRQDIPFVSNTVDFSKINTTAMVPIPKLTGLAFQFAFAYTIDGRNVGKSTTLTSGFMYTLHSARPTL